MGSFELPWGQLVVILNFHSATDSLLSLCLSPHVQQAGRTDGYNQNISQIMPLSIGQLANFMVMLKKTKVRT